MKVKVVQAEVRRNLVSAHTESYYYHEIPILSLIRGFGNVKVIKELKSADCSLPIGKMEPRTELIRLRKKYSAFTTDGENPVNSAFPDGTRDLELFYENPEKYLGSLRVEDEGEDDGDITGEAGHDDLAPVVEEEDEGESTGPVFKDATEGVNLEEVDLDDRQQVITALEKVNAEFSKNTPTKGLANLLVATLEEKAAA